MVSIPAIATQEECYQLSDEPDALYRRRAGEMLHESREGRAELEATRRMQGSLIFSAQYQQAPVPPEGNIVRRDWLRTYTTPPETFDFSSGELGHGLHPVGDRRLFRGHGLGRQGPRLLPAGSRARAF